MTRLMPYLDLRKAPLVTLATLTRSTTFYEGLDSLLRSTYDVFASLMAWLISCYGLMLSLIVVKNRVTTCPWSSFKIS
jgi:hypothetical protein